MISALALSGEGGVWQVPSFMRLNEVRVTDWWLPECTGIDPIDYATGARYFTAAVQTARHLGGLGDVLAAIINAMRNVEVGACEFGFLDTLARKATVGAIPPALSEHDLAGAVRLAAPGFLTPEGYRQGEQEARECLALARLLKWPELIAVDLQAIVERRYGGCAAGFVWVVCGAAMAGGAN